MPAEISYTRAEVAAASAKWGIHLWLPEGIDGKQLLWAMSGCESSFGVDCKPRHEQAYCTGAYSKAPIVVKLTALYGHAAHCSYGPWQILLVNCKDASPQEMVGIDRAGLETVGFLNQRILSAQHASTVEEIAAAWNSGSWRHPEEFSAGVQEYVSRLRGYYDHVPMPAQPLS